MRNALISRLFAGLFASAIATAALADDWTVSRLSGEVWIANDGAEDGVRKVSLGPGATLADGGVVVTGATGRVLLVRGDQSMTIGPNAMVGVPDDRDDSGFTTILQQAGVVEFNVDKRKVQHFAVETPYLAAVVKGTRFVVGAFESEGVVKVTEGRVEVTNIATGQVMDVLPDQQVTVTADGTLVPPGSGNLNDLWPGEPVLPDADQRAAADPGDTDDDILSLVVGGDSGLGVALGGGGVDVGLGGEAGVALDLGSGISLDVGGGSGLAADVGSGGVTVGIGGTRISTGGLLGGGLIP